MSCLLFSLLQSQTLGIARAATTRNDETRSSRKDNVVPSTFVAVQAWSSRAAIRFAVEPPILDVSLIARSVPSRGDAAIVSEIYIYFNDIKRIAKKLAPSSGPHELEKLYI
jgi:hypothetical protein